MRKRRILISILPLKLKILIIGEVTALYCFNNHCKYIIRKYSFAFRIINTWNRPNTNTVEAKDLNTFKKLIDEELPNIQFDYDPQE
jgi:hypothetical protein